MSHGVALDSEPPSNSRPEFASEHDQEEQVFAATRNARLRSTDELRLVLIGSGRRSPFVTDNADSKMSAYENSQSHSRRRTGRRRVSLRVGINRDPPILDSVSLKQRSRVHFPIPIVRLLFWLKPVEGPRSGKYDLRSWGPVASLKQAHTGQFG